MQRRQCLSVVRHSITTWSFGQRHPVGYRVVPSKALPFSADNSTNVEWEVTHVSGITVHQNPCVRLWPLLLYAYPLAHACCLLPEFVKRERRTTTCIGHAEPRPIHLSVRRDRKKPEPHHPTNVCRTPIRHPRTRQSVP